MHAVVCHAERQQRDTYAQSHSAFSVGAASRCARPTARYFRVPSAPVANTASTADAGASPDPNASYPDPHTGTGTRAHACAQRVAGLHGRVQCRLPRLAGQGYGVRDVPPNAPVRQGRDDAVPRAPVQDD